MVPFCRFVHRAKSALFWAEQCINSFPCKGNVRILDGREGDAIDEMTKKTNVWEERTTHRTGEKGDDGKKLEYLQLDSVEQRRQSTPRKHRNVSKQPEDNIPPPNLHLVNTEMSQNNLKTTYLLLI